MQQWIADGDLLLDGQPCERDQAVAAGQQLQLTATGRTAANPVAAQRMQLQLVFRDDHLLVVDKPAGLVCHPAPGHPDNTLMNGLLYLDPSLRQLPRAGLVHRLDRDTTGLLVIARTELAWQSLSRQLRRRSVKRHYLALVRGVPAAGGLLDKAIGRHRHNRLRNAVRADGRPARTHFRVREKFRCHAELSIRLETGRTHQIRLHMTDAGFPLIGDRLYGRGSAPVAGMSRRQLQLVRDFPRQALHAEMLELQHPAGGKPMRWQSEAPQDYRRLRQELRRTD